VKHRQPRHNTPLPIGLPPVAFLSKALNPVERNYEIHNTKMLAIIRGLEEWRHYLEGARHPVEIWTDHKNLEYF
jgi:hypothetical protein